MLEEVDLAALVRERCGSVHAFCRKHPNLCRSTVYLVLSGKYPGNASRQAERIRIALEREKKDVRAVRDRLLAAACAACTLKEKRKRRRCPVCREVCMAQARTLLENDDGFLGSR